MRVAIKKLMIPCDAEVELMASIRHRNIVTCLGYCANPPDYCMIIELAKYNLKHVRTRSTLMADQEILAEPFPGCSALRSRHQAIKHYPPDTPAIFDWALQIAQVRQRAGGAWAFPSTRR